MPIIGKMRALPFQYDEGGSHLPEAEDLEAGEHVQGQNRFIDYHNEKG